MSRLDSFIRRLEAQRACLGRAAELAADLPGAVIELGLGNGRTYDHLRQLFPARAIHVFERQVAAHPDCVPPDEFLWLGDMLRTLPAAAQRLAGQVAVVHLDPGTGEAGPSLALAAALGKLILPLLSPGAIIVSEPPISLAALQPLPLPSGVAPERYRLYRFRGDPRFVDTAG